MNATHTFFAGLGLGLLLGGGIASVLIWRYWSRLKADTLHATAAWKALVDKMGAKP